MKSCQTAEACKLVPSQTTWINISDGSEKSSISVHGISFNTLLKDVLKYTQETITIAHVRFGRSRMPGTA